MIKLPHLGGMTANEFFRKYWQKKPLLIRQAFPAFQSFVSQTELIDLASRDDAMSRLIQQRDNTWTVQHGPFAKPLFKRLPKRRWTLLVHDMNHFSESAQQLLRHFSFIPYSRLDDLMISYAAPQGSVGPHLDSYDVFLLQGMGQRRWLINQQTDGMLIPDSPLRLLKNFKAAHEWVLDPGDMLYLPPNCAHYGIALNECMTYSIGFRAPTTAELIQQFLFFLGDRFAADGQYRDPDLRAASHPAQISQAMFHQMRAMIMKLKWSKDDIAQFLGEFLTEPKQHVFFSAPSRPVNYEKFILSMQKKVLRLDLKTQLLFYEDNFFINGTAFQIPKRDRSAFIALADERSMPPHGTLSKTGKNVLYQWYLDGYINFVLEH